jgi:hypothetical protein
MNLVIGPHVTAIGIVVAVPLPLLTMDAAEGMILVIKREIKTKKDVEGE